MAINVKAKLRYCRVSPQKARLVVDVIRGKPAVEAMDVLRFITKKPAYHIRKLVGSAIANAEENFGLSREDLVVSQIVVDAAPMRKWRRFGARGRFKPVIRRSSHISVVLSERE